MFTLQIGMDDGGRAHFQSEIDTLTHRLTSLRDALGNLSVNVRARKSAKTRCGEELNTAKKYINRVNQVFRTFCP